MKSSGLSLSTLLACFALLAPRVSCQDNCEASAFYTTVTSAGLVGCGNFTCTYAPEIADQTHTLVYCPNDEAIDAYLASNPQPAARARFARGIVRRAVPNANANSAAKGNTGLASNSNNNFGALPPRGSTGGGGGSSAKVSRPALAAAGGGRKRATTPSSYVGTLTAGGGGVSFVLQDAKPFGDPVDNNWYFEIDSFTTASQTIQNTIGTDTRFADFAACLDRLPALREIIFTAYNTTLLIPTADAFKAAGISAQTTATSILEQFVKDHIIVNSCDFIGYTPNYVDGGSFQVYSGKYVSSHFAGTLGTDTILNSVSTIVSPDIVTDKGVIQGIDEPLFKYYTPYCQ